MTRAYRDIRQSSKLLNVRYDVRGPILEEAQRLEAAGQRIMRLNIGNPAPFGFEAPDEILKVRDMMPPRVHTKRSSVSETWGHKHPSASS